MTEHNPFPALLKDGETLLWYGRPNAACWRRAERRGAWIFLACAFVALGVFILAGAFVTERISFYYGIPLYVLVAWAAALKFTPLRRDSPMIVHYAVTNQRILQAADTDGNPLTALALSQIKDVRLRPKLASVSTVVFVPRFFASSGFEFIWIEGTYAVQEKVLALMAQQAVRQKN